MKHALRAIGLILVLTVVGTAQAPSGLQPYPDILASQTAASTALLAYKGVVEANIATNAAAIAKLSDQSVAVQSLQDRLTADEARIAALEAAVKALQSKVASAGTTLATP